MPTRERIDDIRQVTVDQLYMELRSNVVYTRRHLDSSNEIPRNRISQFTAPSSMKGRMR